MYAVIRMALRLAFISLACIFVIWAATESNAAMFFYHRPKPKDVSIIKVIFSPVLLFFLHSIRTTGATKRSKKSMKLLRIGCLTW